MSFEGQPLSSRSQGRAHWGREDRKWTWSVWFGSVSLHRLCSTFYLRLPHGADGTSYTHNHWALYVFIDEEEYNVELVNFKPIVMKLVMVS